MKVTFAYWNCEDDLMVLYDVTTSLTATEFEEQSTKENFVSWILERCTIDSINGVSASGDFLECFVWDGGLAHYYILSDEELALFPKYDPEDY